ncbi:hypothetical protein YC2023_005491 [Brassica napus]
MLRLDTLGIHILKTYEEEWSYIPVGGSLPNTEQKNLAVDANNGRSAAFKRQSGANHIIRSLRNASPAPIKATIDTIPCSIKESNPVILPNGVRNRNITEEHTPFKSTSSSDDLTELKKSKATENEPYQIFLCESISKKEIAVKKSANSFAGGTGVKASVDELYATTCLTFDKSESLRLYGVFSRCTDLTETVVDFWCWEEHKRLQRFFIVYSSRKQLVSVAYVKPLLKGDRFLHAITEYRVMVIRSIRVKIPLEISAEESRKIITDSVKRLNL